MDTPRVAIFAPPPRLTITIEHSHAESDEVHLHAGGQGVWVARMVAGLDAEAMLCAPFGGETGTVLRALLAGEELLVEAVAMGGSNGVYVHDRRSGERVPIAEVRSSALSRHDLDDLYGAALVAGLETPVTVLTGPAPNEPMPASVFRRLAADLTGNDRIVVADLSGERMTEALAGGVTVLKVSDEELALHGNAATTAVTDLLDAVCALSGAQHVVVSRAAEPTLAVIDGSAYLVTTPSVDPLDPKGAGDSMTAGIAASLARGANVLDAVQLGAAAGALNAARRGLGTGERTQIERMAQLVSVEPLKGIRR